MSRIIRSIAFGAAYMTAVRTKMTRRIIGTAHEESKCALAGATFARSPKTCRLDRAPLMSFIEGITIRTTALRTLCG